jgi:hypothetical protein
VGKIGETKRTIIFEPMPDDIPLAEPSPEPVTAPDREAVPA